MSEHPTFDSKQDQDLPFPVTLTTSLRFNPYQAGVKKSSSTSHQRRHIVSLLPIHPRPRRFSPHSSSSLLPSKLFNDLRQALRSDLTSSSTESPDLQALIRQIRVLSRVEGKCRRRNRSKRKRSCWAGPATTSRAVSYVRLLRQIRPETKLINKLRSV